MVSLHLALARRRRNDTDPLGIGFNAKRIAAEVPQRRCCNRRGHYEDPERVEDYLEHIAEAIERVTDYLQPIPDLEAFKRTRRVRMRLSAI